MRDDYEQRHYESVINVDVLLEHIINEGRAPSCYIFIHIDHVKVCLFLSVMPEKGGEGKKKEKKKSVESVNSVTLCRLQVNIKCPGVVNQISGWCI